MIGIIDYGMGNLRSVQKAFERFRAEARIITTPAEILQADKIVLPGVGAFADAIGHLRGSGLVDSILSSVKQGQPFLQIRHSLPQPRVRFSNGLSGDLRFPFADPRYLRFQNFRNIRHSMASFYSRVLRFPLSPP